jgi:uncharacterized protein
MENKDLYSKIASEQNIALTKIEAVVALLEEDATIPFIARYRKEATGSLDEVQIAAIRDRLEQLKELEKRRESILKSMLEMEKLTNELKQKIEATVTLTELEDIYLPYKPKRKTKASMAREKGLQLLADLLLEQTHNNIESEAAKFIDSEKGVNTIAEALSGARDIIAELVNEDPQARASVRAIIFQRSFDQIQRNSRKRRRRRRSIKIISIGRNRLRIVLRIVCSPCGVLRKKVCSLST